MASTNWLLGIGKACLPSWISGRNGEPTSPLTVSHDEATKAQLGLGVVRALVEMDADEFQNRAVRDYHAVQQRVLERRAGVTGSSREVDEMANHVRIDSPEINYGGLAAAVVVGALLLGGAGLAAAWLLVGQGVDRRSAVTPRDTDTRSTLRPYTGPRE